jgi:hypothetical protein
MYASETTGESQSNRRISKRLDKFYILKNKKLADAL